MKSALRPSKMNRANTGLPDSLLVDISTRLITVPANQLDSAIVDSMRLFCAKYGADRCSLWQFAEDRESLLLTHVYLSKADASFAGSPRQFALSGAGRHKCPPQDSPPMNRVNARHFFHSDYNRIRAGETVVLSRLDSPSLDASVDGNARQQFGACSTIAVPLRNAECWLGCLTFDLTEGGDDWSDEPPSEFRLVADLFTSALFRKTAEKQFSEGESLFQTVANCAPVLLWMTDAAGTCVFLNQPWREFTGQPLCVEMVDTWRQCVHAQDVDQLIAEYDSRLRARQPFSAQFRFRRHDGVYRWFRSSAVPRVDAAHQFAGYIGSCVDITDRMEAADRARDLSGRLIKAQEEERARLARELHDDISQRLARLTIDLGRAEREASTETSMQLVRGVHEALASLSEDVHDLSYRLHPSALIDLGLSDALKSECIKLAQREAIIVDMKLRHLPPAIPPEVAIALFRIAQEAMRNAVRHGRARSIHIAMRGLESGLQLAVRDDGIGFDPSHHLNRPSLGLASMRERTRLLRGELDVESAPGQGTTIVAWVPLLEESS